MAERPILFSSAMVRAILEGRKNQTRRALKVQPVGTPVAGQASLTRAMTKPVVYAMWDEPAADGSTCCLCPYGTPGDRLWVREAWNKFDGWAMYSYRADDNSFGIGDSDDPDHVPEHALKWKPSIHMPRAASRITLEITDVRVERLQAISEGDARAEGVEPRPAPGPWWQGYREHDGDLIHQQVVGDEPPEWMIEPHRMRDMKHLDQSAVDGFRSLWSSINGADSWAANPFVWVLTFKPLTA